MKLFNWPRRKKNTPAGKEPAVEKGYEKLENLDPEVRVLFFEQRAKAANRYRKYLIEFGYGYCILGDLNHLYKEFNPIAFELVIISLRTGVNTDSVEEKIQEGHFCGIPVIVIDSGCSSSPYLQGLETFYFKPIRKERLGQIIKRTLAQAQGVSPVKPKKYRTRSVSWLNDAEHYARLFADWDDTKTAFRKKHSLKTTSFEHHLIIAGMDAKIKNYIREHANVFRQKKSYFTETKLLSLSKEEIFSLLQQIVDDVEKGASVTLKDMKERIEKKGREKSDNDE